jgi:hypothetical protein
MCLSIGFTVAGYGTTSYGRSEFGDNLILEVVAATSLSATELKVIFSLALDPNYSLLTSPTNYSIRGLTVIAAELGIAPNEVVLTTSPQENSHLYTVTVTDALSESEAPLGEDNSVQFFGYYGNGFGSTRYGNARFGNSGLARLLEVIAAIPVSRNKVKVLFSAELEPAYAPLTDPLNYLISGLTVRRAVLGPSASEVLLVTTPQTVGNSYTITVSDAQALDGSYLDENNQATFVGYGASPCIHGRVFSRTKLSVEFSADVLPNEALLDPATYIVEDAEGTTIEVYRVNVVDNPIRHVVLSLVSGMAPNSTHTISIVSGLFAAEGSIPIDPQTVSVEVGTFSSSIFLSVPLSSFSGEVSGGLLGQPAGQIFFSPAFSVTSNTEIQLDAASVCATAYDTYTFPTPPEYSGVFCTYGAVSESLLNRDALFAPWNVGLRETKLEMADYHEETMNPLVDGPTTLVSQELLDITRASFLNDTRWALFPGDGAEYVFKTADNLTPIPPGPIITTILQA